MARPLRIEFAGALYHVTSRGDGQEDIYLDDTDREIYLEVLAQVQHRFNWAIHAYCLMSNHYHLLIETPDSNLAKGMRHLNGVYTQRFNRRHKRVSGANSRFEARMVDDKQLLSKVMQLNKTINK
jgi:REP element-mobilizing transposase RayT